VSSRAIVALLFFASGAAALAVETTWLRWFRLLFGATAPAASATLVAFFVGQAAGAALAARRIPRVQRPLATYGALELGAALWALAVPGLLGIGEAATAGVYDDLRASPSALAAMRFTLALLATLPASLCLGATFPAIGAALLRDARSLGSAGAGLYAANLVGGAVGAALASFWLPEWWGVRGAYAVAVSLQVAVGASAIAIARRPAPAPGEPGRSSPTARVERAPRPPPHHGAIPEGGLALLAGLSGFGTLALQVLLVHALALVLNQSVYAFGTVLVVVLASLALGAALVAGLSRIALLPSRTHLGTALAAAAVGVAGFPYLLHRVTDGLEYVGSPGAWPGYFGAALQTTTAAAGLPVLAAALVFPAVLAVAGHGDGRPVAARLGRLVAANTVGAIVGALAAPFVLLPLAGLWTSFGILALGYAIAALVVPDASPRARGLRVAGLAAAGALVLRAADPMGFPAVKTEPGEELVFESTTAAGVVAVAVRDGERLIRTDNHYSLGGSAERVHQERQGHLPLLLHPSARRVAYVGTATGISAGAATVHPVTSIHLVEIVPGVAEAARRYFGDDNRGVYEDARAQIVLDDARNFLRSTRTTFDVIVADLYVPWRAGTHSLYAREHFASARDRLEPGGLFCQWLPLYQLTEREFRVIAATFLDVFPRTAVFRGDFYGRHPIVALVGFEERPASARAVSAAAAELAAAGVSDRWLVDPVGVWSLYVGPLSPLTADLADSPRNTDDRPRIGFLAAQSHAGGSRGVLDPMVGLRWVRFEDALRGAARRSGDDVYPDLGAAGLLASEGGAWLQAAGALWVAGREEQASRALAAASARLPPQLLADAPADPTAAEIWSQ
jgi:spermidine synthase